MSQRKKTYSFKGFVLDVERGCLTRSDEVIALRPKAFAVLQILVEHQGSLVSREQLISSAWGHSHVSDSSLRQCLRDIRLALEDRDQELIYTVPGRGYRFDPPSSDGRSASVRATSQPSSFFTARTVSIVLVILALVSVAYLAVHGSVVSNDNAANTLPQTQPGSIAVLPFADLSPQGNLAYLSDGLTEDLLNQMSGVEGLNVVARTSSFYYKDKLDQVPLSEISRQLNVAYLLEGSVRKDRDQIRVTAQLIRADDGFHVWSKSWDRKLGEIFAVQDEIAASVVEHLSETLVGKLQNSRVVSPESYELALQGRYLINRRSTGDLERALEALERAVRLDSSNATAWIGLAPLYLWLFDPPRIEDALGAAERAISLDPKNPEAWSRQAGVFQASGNYESAQESWARALALGEDNALIQAQAAGVLGLSGDLEGAIAAFEHAVTLDPLAVVNIYNLSYFLILAGRFEEALAPAQRVLSLTPESARGWELIATIQLMTGRPEAARESVEQMDFSDFQVVGTRRPRSWWIAVVEQSLENPETANSALNNFLSDHAERQPLGTASLFAWRGEFDNAFHWLNRALDEHPELAVAWASEPWLSPLKSDPRWDVLMERWTGAQFVREI